MKKWVLTTLLMISFSARAETITGEACGDDCNWYLKDGTLTITGSGKIKEYVRDCLNHCKTDAPWYQYQEDITKVVIQNKSDTEKFDTIGAHAFEDMHSTQEVVLPDGLKTIDNEAFHLNSALEKINLPDTLESIGSWGLSNTNLSEINIPDSVEFIGGAAFNSTLLETLVIPDSVDVLETRICSHCPNLTNIVLPENISSAAGHVFTGASMTNVYCHKKNQTICAQILSASGKMDKEISTILQGYDRQGGVYILDYGTENERYYISGSDMANGTECQKALSECKRDVLEAKGICEGAACDTFIQSDGNYMLKYNGKTYQSINDLLKGNYDRRRIYTIDEANFIAGKVNRVSIRYR
ncbi:MAG: leucine-rich repeat domain-containing protein [Alphaproteobacteria bacterium]|nr:leucine-rich repeat domain-containing protein [Alphaproteobacteria bacterium]